MQFRSEAHKCPATDHKCRHLLYYYYFLGIIRIKMCQILQDQLAALQDSQLYFQSWHWNNVAKKKTVALGILISLFISFCIPEHMHIPCNINEHSIVHDGEVWKAFWYLECSWHKLEMRQRRTHSVMLWCPQYCPCLISDDYLLYLHDRCPPLALITCFN